MLVFSMFRMTVIMNLWIVIRTVRRAFMIVRMIVRIVRMVIMVRSVIREMFKMVVSYSCQQNYARQIFFGQLLFCIIFICSLFSHEIVFIQSVKERVFVNANHFCVLYHDGCQHCLCFVMFCHTMYRSDTTLLSGTAS